MHQRVMLQFAVRRHASGQPTSVADFKENLGCSTRQAERHLRGLLDAGLLSYEKQRPATFRPNWLELEEWATRQDAPLPDVNGANATDASRTDTNGANATDVSRTDTNGANATDASRFHRDKDGANATDMSRTDIPLARRGGHAAAPPAAAPAPPTSEPLLACRNPEPPLPAARPAALSDSEATKLTTAASKWLKSEYRIEFTRGIRGMLKPAVLRGQSEAELRYAAVETAKAGPDSRGSYFLTILDRRWGDCLARWSELSPTPQCVDEETGEILDSTAVAHNVPTDIVTARKRRAR